MFKMSKSYELPTCELISEVRPLTLSVRHPYIQTYTIGFPRAMSGRLPARNSGGLEDIQTACME